MKCPICNKNKAKTLLNLACGNFDDSTLYKTAIVMECKGCGHVYNALSHNEIDGLMKYYNEEYAPSNISSVDFGGDRPGSGNSFSIQRYDQLYKLIQPHLDKKFRILDGGSALGGFLEYLSERGFKNLFGIDISRKYVKAVKNRGPFKIKLGSVESIPFKASSFDFLVIDQVLEHLVNPTIAFKEAERVLSPGGLLCVSIPDASKYANEYFFDFFWFLMREHIQHFDIEHLKILAEKNGFELVDYSRSRSPMMSNKMILPALSAIFKKISMSKRMVFSKNTFKLGKQIRTYIHYNRKRLEQRKKKILSFAESRIPMYVYGLGREFLYLYEVCGLKKCNIIGLIDDTPFKQKGFHVGGMKIEASSILGNANPNSYLLITAFAHIGKLKAKLKKVGFRGQIISI